MEESENVNNERNGDTLTVESNGTEGGSAMRNCTLCGCSTPAVRCDKCSSQVFCLSCDDMYHRHPKRRTHLRKAIDSIWNSHRSPRLRRRTELPGDPSKIPIPPPRSKKRHATLGGFSPAFDIQFFGYKHPWSQKRGMELQRDIRNRSPIEPNAENEGSGHDLNNAGADATRLEILQRRNSADNPNPMPDASSPIHVMVPGASPVQFRTADGIALGYPQQLAGHSVHHSMSATDLHGASSGQPVPPMYHFPHVHGFIPPHMAPIHPSMAHYGCPQCMSASWSNLMSPNMAHFHQHSQQWPVSHSPVSSSPQSAEAEAMALHGQNPMSGPMHFQGSYPMAPPGSYGFNNESVSPQEQNVSVNGRSQDPGSSLQMNGNPRNEQQVHSDASPAQNVTMMGEGASAAQSDAAQGEEEEEEEVEDTEFVIPEKPTMPWECLHCTYVNPPGSHICEICCKTSYQVPKKKVKKKKRVQDTLASVPIDVDDEIHPMDVPEQTYIEQPPTQSIKKEESSEVIATENVEEEITEEPSTVEPSDPGTEGMTSPTAFATETQTMTSTTTTDCQTEVVDDTFLATAASTEQVVSVTKHEMCIQTELEEASHKRTIATDPMISSQSMESLLSGVSAPPYHNRRAGLRAGNSFSTQSLSAFERGRSRSPMPRSSSMMGETRSLGRGVPFMSQDPMMWTHSWLSSDPMYYKPHALAPSPTRDEYYEGHWGSMDRLNKNAKKTEEEKWKQLHGKPRYHKSLENLKIERVPDPPFIQCLQTVKDAERCGYSVDDLRVAYFNCRNDDPLMWLQDNWDTLVKNVLSLAAKCAEDNEEHDVGPITPVEAKRSLRKFRGNIWEAVTECIEVRQRKILELTVRGNFTQKQIVEALKNNDGSVELAYADLIRTTSKLFKHILSPGLSEESEDINVHVQTMKDITDTHKTERLQSKLSFEEEEAPTEKKRSDFLNKLTAVREAQSERRKAREEKELSRENEKVLNEGEESEISTEVVPEPAVENITEKFTAEVASEDVLESIELQPSSILESSQFEVIPDDIQQSPTEELAADLAMTGIKKRDELPEDFDAHWVDSQGEWIEEFSDEQWDEEGEGEWVTVRTRYKKLDDELDDEALEMWGKEDLTDDVFEDEPKEQDLTPEKDLELKDALQSESEMARWSGMDLPGPELSMPAYPQPQELPEDDFEMDANDNWIVKDTEKLLQSPANETYANVDETVLPSSTVSANVNESDMNEDAVVMKLSNITRELEKESMEMDERGLGDSLEGSIGEEWEKIEPQKLSEFNEETSMQEEKERPYDFDETIISSEKDVDLGKENVAVNQIEPESVPVPLPPKKRKSALEDAEINYATEKVTAEEKQIVTESSIQSQEPKPPVRRRSRLSDSEIKQVLVEKHATEDVLLKSVSTDVSSGVKMVGNPRPVPLEQLDQEADEFLKAEYEKLNVSPGTSFSCESDSNCFADSESEEEINARKFKKHHHRSELEKQESLESQDSRRVPVERDSLMDEEMEILKSELEASKSGFTKKSLHMFEDEEPMYRPFSGPITRTRSEESSSFDEGMSSKAYREDVGRPLQLFRQPQQSSFSEDNTAVDESMFHSASDALLLEDTSIPEKQLESQYVPAPEPISEKSETTATEKKATNVEETIHKHAQIQMEDQRPVVKSEARVTQEVQPSMPQMEAPFTRPPVGTQEEIIEDMPALSEMEATSAVADYFFGRYNEITVTRKVKKKPVFTRVPGTSIYRAVPSSVAVKKDASPMRQPDTSTKSVTSTPSDTSAEVCSLPKSFEEIRLKESVTEPVPAMSQIPSTLPPAVPTAASSFSAMPPLPLTPSSVEKPPPESTESLSFADDYFFGSYNVTAPKKPKKKVPIPFLQKSAVAESIVSPAVSSAKKPLVRSSSSENISSARFDTGLQTKEDKTSLHQAVPNVQKPEMVSSVDTMSDTAEKIPGSSIGQAATESITPLVGEKIQVMHVVQESVQEFEPFNVQAVSAVQLETKGKSVRFGATSEIVTPPPRTKKLKKEEAGSRPNIAGNVVSQQQGPPMSAADEYLFGRYDEIMSQQKPGPSSSKKKLPPSSKDLENYSSCVPFGSDLPFTCVKPLSEIARECLLSSGTDSMLDSETKLLETYESSESYRENILSFGISETTDHVITHERGELQSSDNKQLIFGKEVSPVLSADLSVDSTLQQQILDSIQTNDYDTSHTDEITDSSTCIPLHSPSPFGISGIDKMETAGQFHEHSLSEHSLEDFELVDKKVSLVEENHPEEPTISLINKTVLTSISSECFEKETVCGVDEKDSGNLRADQEEAQMTLEAEIEKIETPDEGSGDTKEYIESGVKSDFDNYADIICEELDSGIKKTENFDVVVEKRQKHLEEAQTGLERDTNETITTRSIEDEKDINKVEQLKLDICDVESVKTIEYVAIELKSDENNMADIDHIEKKSEDDMEEMDTDHELGLEISSHDTNGNEVLKELNTELGNHEEGSSENEFELKEEPELIKEYLSENEDDQTATTFEEKDLKGDGSCLDSSLEAVEDNVTKTIFKEEESVPFGDMLKASEDEFGFYDDKNEHDSLLSDTIPSSLKCEPESALLTGESTKLEILDENVNVIKIKSNLHSEDDENDTELLKSSDEVSDKSGMLSDTVLPLPVESSLDFEEEKTDIDDLLDETGSLGDTNIESEDEEGSSECTTIFIKPRKISEGETETVDIEGNVLEDEPNYLKSDEYNNDDEEFPTMENDVPFPLSDEIDELESIAQEDVLSKIENLDEAILTDLQSQTPTHSLEISPLPSMDSVTLSEDIADEIISPTSVSEIQNLEGEEDTDEPKEDTNYDDSYSSIISRFYEEFIESAHPCLSTTVEKKFVPEYYSSVEIEDSCNEISYQDAEESLPSSESSKKDSFDSFEETDLGKLTDSWKTTLNETSYIPEKAVSDRKVALDVTRKEVKLDVSAEADLKEKFESLSVIQHAIDNEAAVTYVIPEPETEKIDLETVKESKVSSDRIKTTEIAKITETVYEPIILQKKSIITIDQSCQTEFDIFEDDQFYDTIDDDLLHELINTSIDSKYKLIETGIQCQIINGSGAHRMSIDNSTKPSFTESIQAAVISSKTVSFIEQMQGEMLIDAVDKTTHDSVTKRNSEEISLQESNSFESLGDDDSDIFIELMNSESDDSNSPIIRSRMHFIDIDSGTGSISGSDTGENFLDVETVDSNSSEKARCISSHSVEEQADIGAYSSDADVQRSDYESVNQEKERFLVSEATVVKNNVTAMQIHEHSLVIPSSASLVITDTTAKGKTIKEQITRVSEKRVSEKESTMEVKYKILDGKGKQGSYNLEEEEESFQSLDVSETDDLSVSESFTDDFQQTQGFIMAEYKLVEENKKVLMTKGSLLVASTQDVPLRQCTKTGEETKSEIPGAVIVSTQPVTSVESFSITEGIVDLPEPTALTYVTEVSPCQPVMRVPSVSDVKFIEIQPPVTDEQEEASQEDDGRISSPTVEYFLPCSTPTDLLTDDESAERKTGEAYDREFYDITSESPDIWCEISPLTDITSADEIWDEANSAVHETSESHASNECFMDVGSTASDIDFVTDKSSVSIALDSDRCSTASCSIDDFEISCLDDSSMFQVSENIFDFSKADSSLELKDGVLIPSKISQNIDLGSCKTLADEERIDEKSVKLSSEIFMQETASSEVKSSHTEQEIVVGKAESVDSHTQDSLEATLKANKQYDIPVSSEREHSKDFPSTTSSVHPSIKESTDDSSEIPVIQNIIELNREPESEFVDFSYHSAADVSEKDSNHSGDEFEELSSLEESVDKKQIVSPGKAPSGIVRYLYYDDDIEFDSTDYSLTESSMSLGIKFQTVEDLSTIGQDSASEQEKQNTATVPDSVASHPHHDTQLQVVTSDMLTSYDNAAIIPETSLVVTDSSHKFESITVRDTTLHETQVLKKDVIKESVSIATSQHPQGMPYVKPELHKESSATSISDLTIESKVDGEKLSLQSNLYQQENIIHEPIVKESIISESPTDESIVEVDEFTDVSSHLLKTEKSDEFRDLETDLSIDDFNDDILLDQNLMESDIVLDTEEMNLSKYDSALESSYLESCTPSSKLSLELSVPRGKESIITDTTVYPEIGVQDSVVQEQRAHDIEHSIEDEFTDIDSFMASEISLSEEMEHSDHSITDDKNSFSTTQITESFGSLESSYQEEMVYEFTPMLSTNLIKFQLHSQNVEYVVAAQAQTALLSVSPDKVATLKDQSSEIHLKVKESVSASEISMSVDHYNAEKVDSHPEEDATDISYHSTADDSDKILDNDVNVLFLDAESDETVSRDVKMKSEKPKIIQSDVSKSKTNVEKINLIPSVQSEIQPAHEGKEASMSKGVIKTDISEVVVEQVSNEMGIVNITTEPKIQTHFIHEYHITDDSKSQSSVELIKEQSDISGYITPDHTVSVTSEAIDDIAEEDEFTDVPSSLTTADEPEEWNDVESEWSHGKETISGIDTSLIFKECESISSSNIPDFSTMMTQSDYTSIEESITTLSYAQQSKIIKDQVKKGTILDANLGAVSSVDDAEACFAEECEFATDPEEVMILQLKPVLHEPKQASVFDVSDVQESDVKPRHSLSTKSSDEPTKSFADKADTIADFSEMSEISDFPTDSNGTKNVVAASEPSASDHSPRTETFSKDDFFTNISTPYLTNEEVAEWEDIETDQSVEELEEENLMLAVENQQSKDFLFLQPESSDVPELPIDNASLSLVKLQTSENKIESHETVKSTENIQTSQADVVLTESEDISNLSYYSDNENVSEMPISNITDTENFSLANADNLYLSIIEQSYESVQAIEKTAELSVSQSNEHKDVTASSLLDASKCAESSPKPQTIKKEEDIEKAAPGSLEILQPSSSMQKSSEFKSDLSLESIRKTEATVSSDSDMHQKCVKVTEVKSLDQKDAIATVYSEEAIKDKQVQLVASDSKKLDKVVETEKASLISLEAEITKSVPSSEEMSTYETAAIDSSVSITAEDDFSQVSSYVAKTQDSEKWSDAEGNSFTDDLEIDCVKADFPIKEDVVKAVVDQRRTNAQELLPADKSNLSQTVTSVVDVSKEVISPSVRSMAEEKLASRSEGSICTDTQEIIESKAIKQIETVSTVDSKSKHSVQTDKEVEIQSPSAWSTDFPSQSLSIDRTSLADDQSNLHVESTITMKGSIKDDASPKDKDSISEAFLEATAKYDQVLKLSKESGISGAEENKLKDILPEIQNVVSGEEVSSKEIVLDISIINAIEKSKAAIDSTTQFDIESSLLSESTHSESDAFFDISSKISTTEEFDSQNLESDISVGDFKDDDSSVKEIRKELEPVTPSSSYSECSGDQMELAEDKTTQKKLLEASVNESYEKFIETTKNIPPSLKTETELQSSFTPTTEKSMFKAAELSESEIWADETKQHSTSFVFHHSPLPEMDDKIQSVGMPELSSKTPEMSETDKNDLRGEMVSDDSPQADELNQLLREYDLTPPYLHEDLAGDSSHLTTDDFFESKEAHTNENDLEDSMYESWSERSFELDDQALHYEQENDEDDFIGDQLVYDMDAIADEEEEAILRAVDDNLRKFDNHIMDDEFRASPVDDFVEEYDQTDADIPPLDSEVYEGTTDFSTVDQSLEDYTPYEYETSSGKIDSFVSVSSKSASKDIFSLEEEEECYTPDIDDLLVEEHYAILPDIAEESQISEEQLAVKYGTEIQDKKEGLAQIGPVSEITNKGIFTATPVNVVEEIADERQVGSITEYVIVDQKKSTAVADEYSIGLKLKDTFEKDEINVKDSTDSTETTRYASDDIKTGTKIEDYKFNEKISLGVKCITEIPVPTAEDNDIRVSLTLKESSDMSAGKLVQTSIQEEAPKSKSEDSIVKQIGLSEDSLEGRATLSTFVKDKDSSSTIFESKSTEKIEDSSATAAISIKSHKESIKQLEQSQSHMATLKSAESADELTISTKSSSKIGATKFGEFTQEQKYVDKQEKVSTALSKELQTADDTCIIVSKLKEASQDIDSSLPHKDIESKRKPAISATVKSEETTISGMEQDITLTKSDDIYSLKLSSTQVLGKPTVKSRVTDDSTSVNLTVKSKTSVQETISSVDESASCSVKGEIKEDLVTYNLKSKPLIETEITLQPTRKAIVVEEIEQSEEIAVKRIDSKVSQSATEEFSMSASKLEEKALSSEKSIVSEDIEQSAEFSVKKIDSKVSQSVTEEFSMSTSKSEEKTLSSEKAIVDKDIEQRAEFSVKKIDSKVSQSAAEELSMSASKTEEKMLSLEKAIVSEDIKRSAEFTVKTVDSKLSQSATEEFSFSMSKSEEKTLSTEVREESDSLSLNITGIRKQELVESETVQVKRELQEKGLGEEACTKVVVTQDNEVKQLPQSETSLLVTEKSKFVEAEGEVEKPPELPRKSKFVSAEGEVEKPPELQRKSKFVDTEGEVEKPPELQRKSKFVDAEGEVEKPPELPRKRPNIQRHSFSENQEETPPDLPRKMSKHRLSVSDDEKTDVSLEETQLHVTHKSETTGAETPMVSRRKRSSSVRSDDAASASSESIIPGSRRRSRPDESTTCLDLDTGEPESKSVFPRRISYDDERTILSRKDKLRLSIEDRMSKLQSEGKCVSRENAFIAAKLIEMQFEEEDALNASKQCNTVYHAVKFLTQLCELCNCRFPVNLMASMSHCPHKACKECLKAHFTTLIYDRSVFSLLCPVCRKPDICDSNIQDYFNHLDMMFRRILESEVYDLFQRKLRDEVLTKDPNFHWCSQCSNGFIASPRLKKLYCPECSTITCASCHQTWESEHEGIHCERFQQWKDMHTPEPPPAGLVKKLTDRGVTCPSCGIKYPHACGGCMLYKCAHCSHKFCGFCQKPYLIGADCKQDPSCKDLGLHAHHPYSCSTFLRDIDAKYIQKWLKDLKIPYATIPAPDQIVKTRCQVREQKHLHGSVTEDRCLRDIVPYFAGLCRVHYMEYLAELLRCHKLSPIPVMTTMDIQFILRKARIFVPEKVKGQTAEEYQALLIQILESKLPL